MKLRHPRIPDVHHVVFGYAAGLCFDHDILSTGGGSRQENENRTVRSSLRSALALPEAVGPLPDYISLDGYGVLDA